MDRGTPTILAPLTCDGVLDAALIEHVPIRMAPVEVHFHERFVLGEERASFLVVLEFLEECGALKLLDETPQFLGLPDRFGEFPEIIVVMELLRAFRKSTDDFGQRV